MSWEKLWKGRMDGQLKMARWQRLYHEHIASIFDRGLYWVRFAARGAIGGGFVFLEDLDVPGFQRLRAVVCRTTKAETVKNHKGQA
jgi:hypothetical protein